MILSPDMRHMFITIRKYDLDPTSATYLFNKMHGAKVRIKENRLQYHLVIPLLVIFCTCKYFAQVQVVNVHTCTFFGGNL